MKSWMRKAILNRIANLNGMALFAALCIALFYASVSNYTLTVRGWTPHDDLLFIKLAKNILETGWLGKYDHFTLIKGPIYPLFIAGNYLLGLPLLLTQNIAYGASVLFLAYALYRYSGRRELFFLGLLLTLFNPIIYINDTHNTLRTVLYLAFLLALFASVLMLVADWEKSWQRVALWGLLAGVFLTLYWLIREEGAWFLPVLAVLALGALVKSYSNRALSKLRLLLLAIPFGVLLLGQLAVSTVNWVKYDFFGTVEFKSDAFLQAYGALNRVVHRNWQPNLPIPKEVRERIYAVSPAFTELRPSLESSGFTTLGCRLAQVRHTCGDLPAGLVLFAFMDAVASRGYYASGATSREFYYRLAREVNAACDRGRLECEPGHRATIIPPLRLENFEPLPAWFWFGFNNVIGMKSLSVAVDPNNAPELFAFSHAITHNTITPSPLKREPGTPENALRFSGWVSHPSGPVAVRVEGDPVEGIYSKIRRIPRGDVFRDDRAATGGFDVLVMCKSCNFVLEAADGTIIKVPLPELGARGVDVERFNLRYDMVRNESILGSTDVFGFVENQHRTTERHRHELRQFIRDTFTAVFPILFWIAVAAYLAMIINAIRVRRITPLDIIATAALAGLLGRVAMLSILDMFLNTYIGNTNYGYLSPAANMASVFTATALIGLYLLVRQAYSAKFTPKPVTIEHRDSRVTKKKARPRQ